MSDKLLTLNEAAEFLGLTHWCLREWIASGRLPFYRVGSRVIRIRQSDLDRLLEAGRVEARPDLAFDGVGPGAEADGPTEPKP